jgi:hypothetical protein
MLQGIPEGQESFIMTMPDQFFDVLAITLSFIWYGLPHEIQVFG